MLPAKKLALRAVTGSRQLQKVNIAGLRFEPKAVARMLQLTFPYRVEWAGRFVRKDAPDGTTAD
jgi:hypothetical protein